MPENMHSPQAFRECCGCWPVDRTLSSTGPEHVKAHFPQPFQRVQKLVSYELPSSAQALLLCSLAAALKPKQW